MRARRSVRALLAVTLALVAAACGGTNGEAGPGTTVPPRPTPLLNPAVASRRAAPGSFALYWMRDCPPPETATDVSGCRLVTGEVRASAEPDLADAIVRTMLTGPSEAERAAGMSTNVRSDVVYDGLSHDGEIVTVRFNRFFETAKSRPQAAQLVFALTQLPEIKAVQILVDGTPNGAVGATPLDRAGVSEFLPDVFVDAPAWGEAVGARFDVSGSAAVDPARVAIGYRVEPASGAATPVETTGAVLGSTSARAPLLMPVVAPVGTAGPATLVVVRGADEVRVPIVVG